LNIYEKFALIYDELIDDIDYNTWGDFINKILELKDLTPQNTLEMACGTGKLTVELSKFISNIDAFDLSSDMLSIAYNKFKDNRNVRLYNLDMKNFKFNKKYDLVICGCDSLNYITNPDDLNKIFFNVKEHLNQNGLFIFDINSYYKISKIIGNNIFLNEKDRIFYTWDSSYDEKLEICDYFLTFFVLKNYNLYERFDEHHRQKAYKTEYIERKLIENGFRSVYKYSDYSFEQIDDTTQRICFVASIN